MQQPNENKSQKDRRTNRRLTVLLAALIVLALYGLGHAWLDDSLKEPSVSESSHTAKADLSDEKENNSSSKDKEEKKKDSYEKETVTKESDSDKNNKEEKKEENSSKDGINKNHLHKADDYSYDAHQVRAIIEGREEPDGKKVAFLTFDDGVHSKITPQVLDILKEKNAKATFFVVGKNLGDDKKPLLERELNEGHAIAIHSLTHDYDTLYPDRVANPERISYEYQKTLEILKGHLGPQYDCKVWRYPGGHMSWENMEAADEALAAFGVEWMDWNSLCGDAEPPSRRPTTPEEMVDMVFDSQQYYPATGYEVILMHDTDNKEMTVQALPAIIDRLKAEGYEFGILE